MASQWFAFDWNATCFHQMFWSFSLKRSVEIKSVGWTWKISSEKNRRSFSLLPFCPYINRLSRPKVVRLWTSSSNGNDNLRVCQVDRENPQSHLQPHWAKDIWGKNTELIDYAGLCFGGGGSRRFFAWLNNFWKLDGSLDTWHNLFSFKFQINALPIASVTLFEVQFFSSCVKPIVNVVGSENAVHFSTAPRIMFWTLPSQDPRHACQHLPDPRLHKWQKLW